ncbi:hypothetical protein AHiyo4_12640 [Arthrobacter sp. Hiyo4]|nr:hypothetical protein AHiyo4_12640 [Arthrobacter sp. Hiyo4]
MTSKVWSANTARIWWSRSAALVKTLFEGYFFYTVITSDLGSGLSANWGPIVIAFWKTAKKSAVHGRHFAGEGSAPGASPDVEAHAAALQLRDVDPIHSFTATEELRWQDPRYVQLWPSDIPHKRR